MPEYIDREKLRNALYEADAILMRGLAIVNQLPAADVAPVRRGRWITAKYPLSTCSVCENSMILCDIANYCPNCGALMKDGDGE